MSENITTTPRWRDMTVTASGAVLVDQEPIEAPNEDEYTEALAIFARAAKQEAAPVLVHSRDEGTGTSSWFTVDEDARMNVATEPTSAQEPTGSASVAPETAVVEASAPVAAAPLPEATEEALPRRRRTAADFSATRPATAPGPAAEGWRGSMNKMGFKLAPGPVEAKRRGFRAEIQRGLAGHRTVSVLNIKGGVSKTTVTYLLAATLGRIRGGNIVAVDNNENRGTLGDRSIPANHDHTAMDLLENIDRFVSPSNAHELQNYIRPQGENRFHVLASQNKANNKEVLDGAAFFKLHSVLRSFYHLMVVDTGNASTASTWQAAVELSDEPILVAMAKEDAVKTLAATVDILIEQGFSRPLGRGVLLLTETPLASRNRKAHLELLARTKEHFGEYVRKIVVLPFDPALDTGGPIVYEKLSKASSDAWLEATAAVVEGL